MRPLELVSPFADCTGPVDWTNGPANWKQPSYYETTHD